MYPSHKVSFQISDVCLEGHYTNQLSLIYSQIMQDLFNNDVNDHPKFTYTINEYEKKELKHLQDCITEQYFKIKFLKSDIKLKTYVNDYEPGVISE